MNRELPPTSRRTTGSNQRQCCGRPFDGGSAALTYAIYYPQKYVYASSLSGFLNPLRGGGRC